MLSFIQYVEENINDKKSEDAKKCAEKASGKKELPKAKDVEDAIDSIFDDK